MRQLQNHTGIPKQVGGVRLESLCMGGGGLTGSSRSSNIRVCLDVCMRLGERISTTAR